MRIQLCRGVVTIQRQGRGGVSADHQVAGDGAAGGQRRGVGRTRIQYNVTVDDAGIVQSGGAAGRRQRETKPEQVGQHERFAQVRHKKTESVLRVGQYRWIDRACLDRGACSIGYAATLDESDADGRPFNNPAGVIVNRYGIAAACASVSTDVTIIGQHAALQEGKNTIGLAADASGLAVVDVSHAAVDYQAVTVAAAAARTDAAVIEQCGCNRAARGAVVQKRHAGHVPGDAGVETVVNGGRAVAASEYPGVGGEAATIVDGHGVDQRRGGCVARRRNSVVQDNPGIDLQHDGSADVGGGKHIAGTQCAGGSCFQCAIHQIGSAAVRVGAAERQRSCPTFLEASAAIDHVGGGDVMAVGVKSAAVSAEGEFACGKVLKDIRGGYQGAEYAAVESH